MKKVMVIYHSQEHGNTAACARLVAEPFLCKGAPDEDCTEAIALGRALGEAVTA